MAREVISLDAIRERIEAQIRTNPEFNDVRPLMPHWHEADETGCNWDLNYWNGPAHLALECRKWVQSFVIDLRTKVNTAPPQPFGPGTIEQLPPG